MTEPAEGVKEKKEKIKYDRALLDKVLERDGATLVGTYEKLNVFTILEYNCKCGVLCKKAFRNCFQNCI